MLNHPGRREEKFMEKYETPVMEVDELEDDVILTSGDVVGRWSCAVLICDRGEKEELFMEKYETPVMEVDELEDDVILTSGNLYLD